MVGVEPVYQHRPAKKADRWGAGGCAGVNSAGDTPKKPVQHALRC